MIAGAVALDQRNQAREQATAAAAQRLGAEALAAERPRPCAAARAPGRRALRLRADARQPARHAGQEPGADRHARGRGRSAEPHRPRPERSARWRWRPRGRSALHRRADATSARASTADPGWIRRLQRDVRRQRFATRDQRLSTSRAGHAHAAHDHAIAGVRGRVRPARLGRRADGRRHVREGGDGVFLQSFDARSGEALTSERALSHEWATVLVARDGRRIVTSTERWPDGDSRRSHPATAEGAGRARRGRCIEPGRSHAAGRRAKRHGPLRRRGLRRHPYGGRPTRRRGPARGLQP